MNGWMRYRDETVADFTGGKPHRDLRRERRRQVVHLRRDHLRALRPAPPRQAEREGPHLRGPRPPLRRVRVRGRRRALPRPPLAAARSSASATRVSGSADGSGEWAQVAGTEKEDALDRAIANVVRLSHEAFTASFLLQQGEATAFIDADPKPRFEIISSLIGLKEYERLEKAAREATRTEKDRTDWINAQARRDRRRRRSRDRRHAHRRRDRSEGRRRRRPTARSREGHVRRRPAVHPPRRRHHEARRDDRQRAGTAR